jgi:uncharacterized protein YdaU (DUF1376 family)
MKNPPSFQFYPRDFLSDINVQAMTMEERGIYITLLCLCWIEDGLPFDDSHPMATLWKKPGVAKCFVEKNGKLRNPRMDRERRKQIKYHKSQQEAGLRGAKKRWGRHSKPIATHMAKNSSSSSSSSSSAINSPLIKKDEKSSFEKLPFNAQREIYRLRRELTRWERILRGMGKRDYAMIKGEPVTRVEAEATITAFTAEEIQAWEACK